MYEDFARIYDGLMEDVDYKEWYSYIREIFKVFDKEPKSVLEMACGTGNFSYYLAREVTCSTCHF